MNYTKNFDYATIRAAVWIVVRNSDYRELSKIIEHTVNSFGKIIASRQFIDVIDTVRAMQLCVEAGIDIKRKYIWRDRRYLLDNLKAGQLKTWLEGYE